MTSPAREEDTDPLAAAIVGIYRRHAIAWTTARGRQQVEADWIDRFRRVLPPGRGDVLDLGCGSGVPIARELVRHGYAVTGVDSAPEMIDLFRRNLGGQTGIVADMRGLVLGRRFAGLLAWDSFFHLRGCEQRDMFAIFRAHAAVGAALMFTSGPREGVAIGRLEGENLYHASLAPAEYRALLDAHGFELIRHVVEDPHCQGRTVWLARANEAVMQG